jgi:hypothetical protein
LLTVARESVVLPLSSFSLKVVEDYVGFERKETEYGGAWAMATFIEATETSDEEKRKELMDKIVAYNKEDLEGSSRSQIKAHLLVFLPKHDYEVCSLSDSLNVCFRDNYNNRAPLLKHFDLFSGGITRVLLTRNPFFGEENSEGAFCCVQHSTELSHGRKVSFCIPILAFAQEIAPQLATEIESETFWDAYDVIVGRIRL